MSGRISQDQQGTSISHMRVTNTANLRTSRQVYLRSKDRAEGRIRGIDLGKTAEQDLDRRVNTAPTCSSPSPSNAIASPGRAPRATITAKLSQLVQSNSTSISARPLTPLPRKNRPVPFSVSSQSYPTWAPLRGLCHYP